MPLLDISNRPIMPDFQREGSASSATRTLAIPPARVAPNTESQEFQYSGSSNLAAGGTDFVQLTDAETALPFSREFPDDFRAKISSILIYCPDMVIDTAAYLFVRITVNNLPANAWGFVPVYPRAGVASLSFTTEFDIQPGAIVQIFGKNTDALNTHFLAVYLQGWQWPK